MKYCAVLYLTLKQAFALRSLRNSMYIAYPHHDISGADCHCRGLSLHIAINKPEYLRLFDAGDLSPFFLPSTHIT